ncbi:ABC transporter permease subunit [Haloferax sp. MBLA0076]|uniref:ABC transporter permease subunit n=1 Tax=Haloferax litoreum TaxID=2666140 RepID=A0A6A8GDW8_9EURY|nr:MULTISPECIES: ABC transporter permease subunit [Haloferax]KAB1192545.1 ABC transporter permease subunit [Haloferax sp. CBA1148]MRX21016.1 ABC transporter permease subunit [Haloferax litoreum]
MRELDIALFEFDQRRRGILIVTALLVATVGLTIAVFPSFGQADVDFNELLESYPEEFRSAFVGSVTDISSLEGYLVVELYQLVWLLIVGSYFAYAAGSLIAGEVDRQSVELILVRPVSRTRFVVGKFLAMLPAVVLVDIVVFVAVILGAGLIDEEIRISRLVLVHAVGGLYLVDCVAIGLLTSAFFQRVRRAQGAAIGIVFGTFLLDSLTMDTDYEFLGSLSLTRYIDPGELLVAGDVDWGGVAVLLVTTCVLVVLAAEVFERRDLS